MYSVPYVCRHNREGIFSYFVCSKFGPSGRLCRKSVLRNVASLHWQPGDALLRTHSGLPWLLRHTENFRMNQSWNLLRQSWGGPGSSGSSSRGTRSSVASTHVSWLTTAGTPVWVGGWGRRTLCSLLTSVGTWATACWLPGALRATGTCSPGAGRSVLVPTLRTPSLHCHLVLLLAGHSTPPFLHSPGAHPPAMARVWAKEWRGSWSKPGSARRG